MKWLLIQILFDMGCEIKLSQEQETEIVIQQRPDDENQPDDEPRDEPEDIDQDGFTVSQGDCDDWNPNIHPNALEIWNFEDDNCDGFEDVDGMHSGTLTLAAEGIYEGTAYPYSQTCTGTSNRSTGHLSLEITCSIDHSQELAEQMLGGILTVLTEADFVNEMSFDGDALFTSTDGVNISTGESFGWDSQGEISLDWRPLEQNSGNEIQVEANLEPWTGYLDIEINGTLYRQ